MPRQPRSAWIESHHGKYRVRWREPGVESARASSSFATKREALVALGDVKGRLDHLANHMPAPGVALPIADVVKRWKAARLSDESPISPGSALDYESAMARLISDGGWKTTRDITLASLSAIRTKREGRNCSRTFAYCLAIVRWARDFLDQPVDPRVMERRRAVRRPRKAPRRGYTADEMAVLELRAKRYGIWPAMRHVQLYGHRWKEVVRRKVGDVDRANRTLLIEETKNGDDVLCPLLDETMELIAPRLLLGHEAPLYPNPAGEFWPLNKRCLPSTLYTWWWRHMTVPETPGEAIERGGPDALPVTFDGVRGLLDVKRRAIRRLLQAAEGDIAAAQGVTGHRSRALLVYPTSALADSRTLLERAAEIERQA